MNIRALLATAVIALASTAAIGQDFGTHTLRGYPLDTDCQADADQIGAAFAEASGRDVIYSLCSGPNERGYTLTLNYLPDGSLPLVTTDTLGSGLNPHGTYADIETCREDLDNQITEFTETTGLTPFAAYCQNESVSREYPFMARIDAIGNSENTPQISGSMIFSSPAEFTLEQFENTIKENLGSLTPHLRDVKVHQSMVSARVTATYYGNEKIDFTTVEWAKLRTVEQCQAELALAQAAFLERDLSSLINFCGFLHVGAVHEVTFLLTENFRTFVPPVTFEDYEDCTENRNSHLDALRDRNLDPLTALCTYSTNDVFDPTTGYTFAWRLNVIFR